MNTERFIHDLHNVITAAEHVLEDAVVGAGDKTAQVRLRAEHALHDARRDLTRAERRAARQVRVAARRADRYVHRRAWNAVGIAAGVGFLAGCLIARRAE